MSRRLATPVPPAVSGSATTIAGYRWRSTPLAQHVFEREILSRLHRLTHAQFAELVSALEATAPMDGAA